MFGLTHTQLMHTASAAGPAVPFGVTGIGELSEGAAGSAVRELQSKLNVLQYGPVVVDGSFGGSTKQALMNFQQTEGIGGNPPSGVLDAETEARLNQRILSVSNGGAGGGINPQTGVLTQPAAGRPWWQTALMVAGGIAIVGGILYMLSEEHDKAGYRRALQPGRAPKEIEGRYNSKGTRVAGLHRAKCKRTPGDGAFDEGEPLEAPTS